MKLETENRKRPKETKASSSWERTGPRQPCTRKASRRAPRSRGRVAAPCAARVPTFPPPPAPSRPCPGQLSLLLRRESSCVVLRAPAQRRGDSVSGRPAQLGVGGVPHRSLSWEVNTARCRGGRPGTMGSPEGVYPGSKVGSRGSRADPAWRGPLQKPGPQCSAATRP